MHSEQREKKSLMEANAFSLLNVGVRLSGLNGQENYKNAY